MWAELLRVCNHCEPHPFQDALVLLELGYQAVVPYYNGMNDGEIQHFSRTPVQLFQLIVSQAITMELEMGDAGG